MTPQEAMTTAAKFAASRRKLFGERVMMIRDEEVSSIGLIELPGTLRKQSGTVVMIGVDVDLAAHDVKVGDRVLFTKYQPTEVALDTDEDEVPVIIMHITDLYVGTDAPELREFFFAEYKRITGYVHPDNLDML